MLLASSHLLRCIPNRPLPKVLPAIPLKDYVRKAIQGHPILSFRYRMELLTSWSTGLPPQTISTNW